MSEQKNEGKTLYNSTEEALNAISDSINYLDKRIDDLIVSFNEKRIEDAANLIALFKVLNLSQDDIFDFYNYAKKEKLRMSEKINSRSAG